MTVLVARVVLLVVALLVWGYGYRYDNNDIRLVGILLMVAAVLMRFLGKRPSRRGPVE